MFGLLGFEVGALWYRTVTRKVLPVLLGSSTTYSCVIIPSRRANFSLQARAVSVLSLSLPPAPSPARHDRHRS